MSSYRIRLVDAGNRSWEKTMEESDLDLPEAVRKLVANQMSIRLPAIIIDSDDAPMPEWSSQ